MKTTDLAELIALAAIWGASFFFMRVAAPEFGPVALAAYTSGSVDLSMGADAVELLLYGNAHRTGAGQAFTASGSGASAGAAYLTVAGSGTGTLTIVSAGPGPRRYAARAAADRYDADAPPRRYAAAAAAPRYGGDIGPDRTGAKA